MIDRSRTSFETAPSEIAIDAWRVKLFCQATGAGSVQNTREARE